MDRQTSPCFGSLRSTRGPAPTHPLNNKTPAVATDRLVCARLVCAPPCVCTALPMEHQTTRASLDASLVTKRWGKWVIPDFRPATSPARLSASRSAGGGSAEPISLPSRYVRRTQVRLDPASPPRYWGPVFPAEQNLCTVSSHRFEQLEQLDLVSHATALKCQHHLPDSIGSPQNSWTPLLPSVPAFFWSNTAPVGHTESYDTQKNFEYKLGPTLFMLVPCIDAAEFDHVPQLKIFKLCERSISVDAWHFVSCWFEKKY